MKIARVFLTAMYLHLALSIALPIVLLGQGAWNTVSVAALVTYLVTVAAVQILGWVCVGTGVYACQKGKTEKLKRGWRLLKLGAIAFYILNFIYSFLLWFALVGASRGVMIFLVPIPVFFTCMLIVQSGCLGCCYIRYLRKQPENGGKPAGIHYLLQLISVLDVVSTIVLLKKYPLDKTSL